MKGVSADTQHPGTSAPYSKFKEQNLGITFYHKVLRKTVKIVEKWLKVLTGCRGIRVLGASTYPLDYNTLILFSVLPTPSLIHLHS
jgi:hypothetical protein